MALSMIGCFLILFLANHAYAADLEWYFTPIAGGSVYGYDETNNKSFTSRKLPDGVAAQREDGINALFVPKGKEIDLGDFGGTCLSNPNLCKNFTVSFFLKLGDFKNTEEKQVIFDSGQELSAYGWTVTAKQYSFSDTPKISGYIGTKNSLQGTDEDVPANSSWIHVAFVYASRRFSTDLMLYLNGNRSEPQSMSGSSTKHNADVKTRLTLGSPKNDKDFRVGFLQFTEKELSADEIGKLYQSSMQQAKMNFSVTMKLLVSTLEVRSDVGVAKVPVERSGDLQIASSVGFQTSDGTAKAPGDYTAEADGELVFKPGEIYKELEVSIVENYKSGNRTLSVTLKKLNSPSVEVTLSGLTEVDITIIDSGERPTTGTAVRGQMTTSGVIIYVALAVVLRLFM